MGSGNDLVSNERERLQRQREFYITLLDYMKSPSRELKQKAQDALNMFNRTRKCYNATYQKITWEEIEPRIDLLKQKNKTAWDSFLPGIKEDLELYNKFKDFLENTNPA